MSHPALRFIPGWNRSGIVANLALASWCSPRLLKRFVGSAPVAASIESIMTSIDASQTEYPATIWDFLETNATAMRPLAKIILFMAGVAVVLAITASMAC